MCVYEHREKMYIDRYIVRAHIKQSNSHFFQQTLNIFYVLSVQFNSVAQLCRLFATPWTAAWQAFPVHHQLLKNAQTHVHRVGDAIQPSHPLLSPFPPAFNLSQYQGPFK